MRSAFLASASGVALSFLGAPAFAQDPESDRLLRLEALIAEQTAALEALREELADVRTRAEKVKPPAPTNLAVPPRPAGCTLAGEAARSKALTDPAELMRSCFGFENGDLTPSGVDALAEASFDKVATTVPGRSLAPAGITPQISLGNKSEASLTLGAARYWRICYSKPGSRCGKDAAVFNGYRPVVSNLSVTFTAALDKGEGRFADIKGDDFDLTSDAKIRAEYSRAYFAYVSSAGAGDKLSEILKEIEQACAKDRKVPCIGDDALDWLRSVNADAEAPGGIVLAHADMAQRLSNAFFRAPETAKPQWGWGLSGEIGKKNITYLEGLSYAGPDPDNPGKNKLITDLSQTPTSMTDEKLDIALEAHAFYAHEFSQPYLSRRLRRVMVVGQLAWLRDWRLPKGSTDINVCDIPAGTTLTDSARITCRKSNIAAPIRFTEIVASIEGKLEWDGLPFFGRIGIAPKFAYGLDDGGIVMDVPLYLGSELGGGVRLTHSFDGRDLLGNDKESETSISVFFTPWKF
jgi:hypothetical protein